MEPLPSLEGTQPKGTLLWCGVQHPSKPTILVPFRRDYTEEKRRDEDFGIDNTTVRTIMPVMRVEASLTSSAPP